MTEININEPFVYKNNYGPTVLMGEYNSVNNMYTFPCNGMLAIRNDAGFTGRLALYDSNPNNFIMLWLGGGTGCYITYVIKGMRAWLEGTASTSYFLPLI